MTGKVGSRLIFISLFLAILIISVTAGCTQDINRHSPASQQRFDDINYWVKMFEDPERDEWQKPEEVVSTMNIRKGDTVADIGAGTGYFTRRFAVAVGEEGKAIGLDIEKSMVDYMREDAKKLELSSYAAQVVKTDHSGLEKSSVDIVFLCNTYHHIENRVKYFKDVQIGLRESGRVVIVDFYQNTDFGPPRDHKLAKHVVLKEMEQAGYVLLKDLNILPEQYYLEFGM